MFTGLVSTNIVPYFRGPASPPEIIAWLRRCDDSFASFSFLNPSLKPPLDDKAKIRFAGTALQEKDMMMWWSANRNTFLTPSSPTWKAFVDAVKLRFITDAWRLEELMRFNQLRQENREFKDFARELLQVQDVLTAPPKVDPPPDPPLPKYPYAIDDDTIIRHLLFFANEVLMRRVMDLSDFKLETIKRDELVSLMTFQWDLMKREGISVNTQPWEALY